MYYLGITLLLKVCYVLYAGIISSAIYVKSAIYLDATTLCYFIEHLCPNVLYTINVFHFCFYMFFMFPQIWGFN